MDYVIELDMAREKIDRLEAENAELRKKNQWLWDENVRVALGHKECPLDAEQRHTVDFVIRRIAENERLRLAFERIDREHQSIMLGDVLVDLRAAVEGKGDE